MKEQLRLLIELQGFDARILEASASLQALPEKLKPAKNDLAKLEGLLQGERTELARTETWRRDQEAALKDESEAIKRAKSKLQESKNSRDYAAANRELDHKRRTMSDREEETLKLIDAIESSRKSLEGHDGDVETLRSRIREEEESMQGAITELEQVRDAAAAQRVKVTEKIDPTLLKRYEHVLKRRGIALVPIEEGACKGCHVKLPPQLVNTIHRKDSIEACPQCYRLLFTPTMLDEPIDKPV